MDPVHGPSPNPQSKWFPGEPGSLSKCSHTQVQQPVLSCCTLARGRVPTRLPLVVGILTIMRRGKRTEPWIRGSVGKPAGVCYWRSAERRAAWRFPGGSDFTCPVLSEYSLRRCDGERSVLALRSASSRNRKTSDPRWKFLFPERLRCPCDESSRSSERRSFDGREGR